MEGKGRFEGPEGARRCRDVIFLLLIIIAWGVLGVIASLAVKKGEPTLLVLPMDFEGNLCGQDNTRGRPWIEAGKGQDFSKKPYLYFLNPFNLTNSICVDQCPTETKFSPQCQLPASKSVFGYNVPTGANRTNCMCTYDNSDPVVCFGTYESGPVARRCVPGNVTMMSEELKREIRRFSGFAEKATQDEVKGWRWLIAAAGIAFGLGFVWMILLRFLGGVMVWTSIILSWLACAGFSVWLYLYSTDKVKNAGITHPNDADYLRNVKALRIASYVFLGLSAVLLCLILFMFRRIMIAIGCVKHAARAIAAMPFLFVVPVVTFFIVCGVFVFFVYISVYLISAGEVKVEGCCRRFVFDRQLEQMIYFHIFGVIWTILFFIGCAALIVNTAVAGHYFQGKKTILAPVAHATGIVLANHLGSVAFGTLAIAVVATIRIWFAMLQKQMKSLQESSTVRFVLCCVNCCLACFQRFLEFITTHAFVQVAITGKGFCGAARDAWTIMTQNPIRIAAVSGVSAFVIILGKIFITVMTTFITIQLLNRYTDPKISSLLMYTIVAFIAYVIADCFLEVFETAVRTVLHCFIIDEEHNVPDVYAHESLSEHMARVPERKHVDAKVAKSGHTPLKDEDHKI